MFFVSRHVFFQIILFKIFRENNSNSSIECRNECSSRHGTNGSNIEYPENKKKFKKNWKFQLSNNYLSLSTYFSVLTFEVGYTHILYLLFSWINCKFVSSKFSPFLDSLDWLACCSKSFLETPQIVNKNFLAPEKLLAEKNPVVFMFALLDGSMEDDWTISFLDMGLNLVQNVSLFNWKRKK